ncbi:MAG: hypothetical protein H7Z14_18880 [Anaerolineae bacterium]|nr:hypothetical protein [Phycisphaerae bacterium]
MDKKTYGIGILTVTALVLFLANLMPIRTAQADMAFKERDFTLVTSRISLGGEALYICDNRTGQMAVFTWEAAARQIRLRDLKPVLDLFHD